MDLEHAQHHYIHTDESNEERWRIERNETSAKYSNNKIVTTEQCHTHAHTVT